MSAAATGWVWNNSPYTGPIFTVHLAIADVVNDAHGNEFWMSTDSLAKKARVSRSTAVSSLKVMVDDGNLEVVEAGGASRKPTRYRFIASASRDLTSASQSPASASGAHKQEEHKEQLNTASASLGLDPNDREPDPKCIRCRGTGELYGTAERPRRCSCTFVVDPALLLVDEKARA